ncbi:MAG TPA: RsmE family RNA methyltransferase [Kiritimatiellia bacterium]|jgi:16S rRNA (uracil1498-N3)-methyltransferase|nr:RsmE family RNA methyltransferase [Kiritimatiellia bacterium]HOM58285.1 RsmE family RNA methyltransferase [Kiritimatiellia bacterium]HPC48939.1 RsmE family RNA methyltransferase [Kiritimatiellia bacterium]HPK36681.1 RsmE family RNA methyltransferase [Kiritimatiellia bacterium]HPW74572.1 RsmE family RNA methyltransferase [Kiritimatiellia bacterium]
MHRCLVTTENLLADTLTLGREASHHLHTVLRVRPDDPVVLFDGQGRTRRALVRSAERHSVALTAAEPAQTHPAPVCAITLFACISKGHRMDWTVEKAVELGIARLVPVISEHTVVRLAPGDREGKAERWRRVAAEAARQCGAVWMPTIVSPLPFREALPLVATTLPVFTAALTPAARPLREVFASHSEPPVHAGWFVGPEGDFSEAELAELTATGATPVSLGPLVLRSETACLYGLCALNAAWL